MAGDDDAAIPPSRAVITVGGDVTTVLALTRFAQNLPSEPARTIAADQGWALARRLDLSVDVLVGDLDSIDADELETAAAAGTDVRRHPADKDATDLELAIDVARTGGAREIVVLDGGGPRLDHLLANVAVAASAAGDAAVTLVTATAVLTLVTSGRAITGSPGDLVTLLALFGRVEGVTTTGLLYPLSGQALLPGSSLGVSNELVAPTARVTVEGGTLLVVQPATTTTGGRP